MKLSRFLYHATRKGSKEVRLILAAGRVTVDGHIEKDSQREIGTFTRVDLDGKALQHEQPIYMMLNKPSGYLSATTDPEHPTVMELIDVPQTLHIAGRLDRASTGLLILTNDGKWSRALTEPKEGVPKTYLITTADPIAKDTVEHFKNGIYFAYEDLTTQPADLEILDEKTARLTIYEGRYHQVKRMFHAVGNRVTSLHRERIGTILLDPALQPGESRFLTDDEIKKPELIK
ncbi:MAG: pseudouridine synthase [Akkermansiaceae bacterium]